MNGDFDSKVSCLKWTRRRSMIPTPAPDTVRQPGATAAPQPGPPTPARPLRIGVYTLSEPVHRVPAVIGWDPASASPTAGSIVPRSMPTALLPLVVTSMSTTCPPGPVQAALSTLVARSGHQARIAR